jgi:hypothetical protein
MPSGRDSFRRNRVAPIGYSVLLLRFVLRLATGLLYHPRQGGCGLSREDVSECGGQAYFAAGARQRNEAYAINRREVSRLRWRGSFVRANEKEKPAPLHSEAVTFLFFGQK